MFSNVNEVVQQLYLAEREGYRFVIDWRNSCYADPTREEDPWEYYFEQPFAGSAPDYSDLPLVSGGESVACAKDNIITPRERDGECDPLLLPCDRGLPHRIIDQYLQLKPTVSDAIDEFRARYFASSVIGLHIRGAGRTDGGVPRLRESLPKERGIPLTEYFKVVEEALTELPDARVFVSSDSAFAIRRCAERFGDRLLTFPSQRSEFGEMHVIGHPENLGLNFDRPQLGMEVLQEACLLAATDLFVHGNSNLVNFVLCLNPTLSHIDVYEAGRRTLNIAAGPQANSTRPMTQVLCISGMHRSGTSLTASWLESCGLNIHDGAVHGPATGNPKGHFEDKLFVDIHAGVIRTREPASKGWKTSENHAIPMGADALESAEILVKERSKKYPRWGWKDPRTVFFLEQWKELIPELKVLLVWRSCDLVVDSLLRRSEAAENEVFKLSFSEAKLLWRSYNMRICDYKRAHPDDTLLLPIERIIMDDRHVHQLIRERLGLGLSFQPVSRLFEPGLFRSQSSIPPMGEDIIHIENELQALSDLPLVKVE